MSLRAFLVSLLETGRAQVAHPGAAAAEAWDEVDELLRTCDRAAREQLAGVPPALSLAAARWGAERLHKACQMLAYRDVDAQTVRRKLAEPCPLPATAETIYSVDLALRFLPDVLSLARAVAEGDVLVDELRRLACRWPLSSVGVRDLGDEPLDRRALETILGHPSLRQLYLDRVIAVHDASRLAHATVADGVRESLGMFGELCPELAQLVAPAEVGT